MTTTADVEVLDDQHQPEAPRTERPAALKLVTVVLGLAAAVSLMVLAFLAPAINSGPKDLPLAISGPAQATDQIRASVEKAEPGAFATTGYDDLAAVETAVHDREAVGGISVGADGAITIVTAGGAGTPYSAMLTQLGAGLQQSGAQVTVRDIAPLTQDDPNGTGLSALAMPLAFGGMISAVLLSRTFRHRPVMRVIGSAVASIVVGFAVVAILQFGFGSVDGDYVTTALALSLGTAAISLFVLGMESLLGFAGLGIGGVLMMFVGNPLSGMATGWQWLPAPWGFIGQLLPIGSAGTLIRSTAFFDGHGAGMPILVLSCWIVLGIALAAFAAMRRRGKHATVVA